MMRVPGKFLGHPGLPVSLGALALYVATYRPVPIPGVSAYLLSKHLWLDDFPVHGNPLWGLIGRGVLVLVPQHTAAIMNGFSVACGVLVIYLTCAFNLQLLRFLGSRRGDYVHALCGAGAGLYLAVCTPFWLIATRAHPLPFDLALTLIVLLQLLRYQRLGGRTRLYFFAFVYGIAFVEYSGVVLMAIPVFILVMAIMWSRHHIRQSILIRAGLSFGAGLGLLYLLVVWLGFRSPASVWMEDISPLQMFRSVLGYQRSQALQSIPRTGWLLVFAVSILPWMGAVIETQRRRSSVRHLPSFFMFVVLSILPLAVLFNTPAAPWRVLGENHLIVLPYFFIASYFGLVLNYWNNAIVRLWQKLELRLPISRAALISILPLCVVVAPGFTYRHVVPDRLYSLVQCADHIVEAVGDRPWLVTDGSLDPLIHLAAQNAGKEIALFSFSAEELSTSDGRALAAHFDDPRHISLAQVGLVPLLRELLQTEPGIEQKLAFQNTGNMWLEGGYTVVPDRLVFLGSRDPSSVNVEALMKRHYEFWESVVPGLWGAEQHPGIGASVAMRFRWQASRVANDLGIFLHSMDQTERARLAYRAARTINERNASALINLTGLDEFDREELPDDVLDEIQRSLPQLIGLYGHIHRMGDLWKARGQEPSVMDEGLREQIQRVIETYQSGDVPSGFRMLNEMAEADEENQTIWYLRGLLAAALEDEEVWNTCWEYMLTRKYSWPPYLMIQGERLMREGRKVEGMDLYESAYNASPYNPAIVRPVAMASFAFGDKQSAVRFVKRLISLEPSDPWGHFALGTIQFHDGDFELAESSLRVAEATLKVPHAPNNLAWLLIERGAYDEAESYIDRALAMNPNFAPALDTKAVLRIRQSRFDEAEEAFSAALALAPDDWDVHVHHVHLQIARGDMGEARRETVLLEMRRTDLEAHQLIEFKTLCETVGLPFAL